MVSLPSFKRHQAAPASSDKANIGSHPRGRIATDQAEYLTPAQIRRATRTRLIWALLSSFFLLLAFVFLILVEVGNTSVGSVVNNIYFLKLNLSQVVPLSVPNAPFINNIAQTIGLHDFYTAGLWGYCEGYFSQGFTSCSKPETLYWFNPVEIVLSELLAGATITFPSQATTYLEILRVASRWMFALFLSGVCLTFVLIFISLLTLYSRWAALLIGILSLLNAIVVTVATILATAIFVILQMFLTSIQDLNIQANIGKEMFAFMWIAAVSTIIAWMIHTGMCCCCASRRDLKTGKKKGRNSERRASHTQTAQRHYHLPFGSRRHHT